MIDTFEKCKLEYEEDKLVILLKDGDIYSVYGNGELIKKLKVIDITDLVDKDKLEEKNNRRILR